MNALDEVSYRLALAKGFLAEAKQDFDLSRWRSCVDNAQLTVENSGKAILASFGAEWRQEQAAAKNNNPSDPPEAS